MEFLLDPVVRAGIMIAETNSSHKSMNKLIQHNTFLCAGFYYIFINCGKFRPIGTMRPVLLPRDLHLSVLIFQDCHNKFMHNRNIIERPFRGL